MLRKSFDFHSIKYTVHFHSGNGQYKTNNFYLLYESAFSFLSYLCIALAVIRIRVSNAMKLPLLNSVMYGGAMSYFFMCRFKFIFEIRDCDGLVILNSDKAKQKGILHRNFSLFGYQIKKLYINFYLISNVNFLRL